MYNEMDSQKHIIHHSQKNPDIINCYQLPEVKISPISRDCVMTVYFSISFYLIYYAIEYT